MKYPWQYAVGLAGLWLLGIFGCLRLFPFLRTPEGEVPGIEAFIVIGVPFALIVLVTNFPPRER